MSVKVHPQLTVKRRREILGAEKLPPKVKQAIIEAWAEHEGL